MGVKPGPVDAMVVVKPKPDATSASGIRSTLYKGYSSELPDPSTLNPLPAYADMEPDSLPLICSMNITSDKPLVDSIFGKVQTGSILSYQHPPPPPDSVVIHEDAPPFPKVPLDDYHLQPTDCTYEPTDQEKLHLSSLSVTLSQSHLIEEATRGQSATPEWHSLRKERVTASHFREASHVSGTSSAEKLAERIIRGTKQTTLMKRGLEMEAGALKDYAVLKNLNLTKCGLVIHPDAPWLGALPDGLVYGPLERPSFGLVEIKCPNVVSYVDCKFLRADHGLHKLKESHCYYLQIQGQLLITGMAWCDFVVCAHDDIFVQRISQDSTVLSSLKERCDLFFFNTYMSKYLFYAK
ncbi:uncharacterized protein LOC115582749 isoform X2 [Sparus aurata]|uniref:uncharacterized protein LOC115582749 isoform X2 n=1 Tax=Sparus aurata TaxID=8175 RepID=UPI0011C15CAE|nr:uncharacterized protein LOC115582749 isoform X2 [Sparus aurata]XP_030274785.1 uncharacterized protein LOC115582749 isoform X2 [Sparus aurata]XP_030274786.1 uncharacterized protein LOC115582749 isoform X2 [Sparus aurata]